MQITEIKKDEVSVKLDNEIYRFWIHGLGLIPMHKNPVLWKDAFVKEFIRSKIQLKHDS